MHPFGREKSRLQKKLSLYFILIAVVSISVSVEMIFEFSSSSFREEIKANLIAEVQQGIPGEYVKKIDTEKINEAISDPISNFRNRIIIVMIIICASIIAAFRLFTSDIVSPMEKIVEATKKIADGDLTVKVPVMSSDEIGQVAQLINDMNSNLSRMVTQIRQELDRYKIKIQQSGKTISLISQQKSKEMMEKREIRVSDFKKMMKLNSDVVKLLDSMLLDTDSLETFVSMYKTYSLDGGSNVRQNELDKILEEHNAQK
jgi:methyl-accepting chemotaxis protein